MRSQRSFLAVFACFPHPVGTFPSTLAGGAQAPQSAPPHILLVRTSYCLPLHCHVASLTYCTSHLVFYPQVARKREELAAKAERLVEKKAGLTAQLEKLTAADGSAGGMVRGQLSSHPSGPAYLGLHVFPLLHAADRGQRVVCPL